MNLMAPMVINRSIDMAGVRIDEGKKVPLEDLVKLYASVGWVSYTENPLSLKLAVENSSYVCTAWLSDELLGLARCISDDVHIVYLQDILINPGHQRRGVGKKLMKRIFSRFEHVRQMVLLTDDSETQLGFYEAMEMKDIRKWKGLTAFLRLKGAEPPS